MKPQGCGCCDFDGPETLATPARNNYFYGKLLDEQHFRLEQRYFNNKRLAAQSPGRWGGRVLRPGVEADSGRPAGGVGPGAAADGLDVRSSCRPLQYSICASSPTPAASRRVRHAGPVTIRLAYHPCAAEPMPVLVPDCESKTRCARVRFASLSPSWSARRTASPRAGMAAVHLLRAGTRPASYQGGRPHCQGRRVGRPGLLRTSKARRCARAPWTGYHPRGSQGRVERRRYQFSAGPSCSARPPYFRCRCALGAR